MFRFLVCQTFFFFEGKKLSIKLGKRSMFNMVQVGIGQIKYLNWFALV